MDKKAFTPTPKCYECKPDGWLDTRSVSNQCPGRKPAVWGFTLLELMVAMAIVGILTAATAVSLNSSRTKKEVEVAAREVTAAIREAQNYALTGKRVSDTEYPCDYKFNATIGASGYSIEYDYHVYGSTTCDDSNVLYSSSLKNKVTFKSVAPNPVSFSIPYGSTNPAARVVLEKKSLQYTVCVNSSGNIEEKIGDVACP